MLDAIYTIVRRIIQHHPIYIGDGQHLHHQLLKLGWSRKSISLLYWFFSFSLGFLSLFLNSTQKFYTFLSLALIFFAVVFSFPRHT